MSEQVESIAAPAAATGRAGSGPRTLLIASIALIVVIAAVRASYSWATDAWVNHPAGALIAMAADLKHGLFYRPLFGPVGYGGTRYFPLYFVLQALLMKLGLPVLFSAYLLSAAAMISLLAGVFYLLRGLDVEPWLAACSAAALLAVISGQQSLVSPHADGLASSLNVWGLAVIVRQKLSHGRAFLASLLFVLAWSAKVLTVFGFAAAFVWLISTGLRTAAWELAGETCIGYLVVGAALVAGSQGRFVEIFKACASGGTGLLGFAAGPWNLLVQIARLDPAVLLFLFLALVALAQVVVSGKFLRNIPALFFVAVLVITALIFGSPGLNENHFLDVQVASVVLIASSLAQVTVPLYRQVGICALAVVMLVAAVPLLRRFKNGDRRFHPHRFQKVLAAVGDTSKPILSENPVIPVLAGQQPYVLDPWMLRLLRKKDVYLGEPLLERLRNQDFGAVVLCMADPKTNFGQWWFETNHFGPGFAAALNQNYHLVATFDDQRVYLPIADIPEKREPIIDFQ
ncbi:MAG: hypothetical protein ACLPND_16990 [Candidatus Korobacteraceae bacterium]